MVGMNVGFSNSLLGARHDDAKFSVNGTRIIDMLSGEQLREFADPAVHGFWTNAGRKTGVDLRRFEPPIGVGGRLFELLERLEPRRLVEGFEAMFVDLQ